MASPTVKLPKVTQYVRNVGRSVAFASINSVKNNMEGIKGFTEDNEDVFVEIYSGAKNFRETLKKAERSIKDSNLYKAIEYGAKNMIEDAKTGNFYNDRTSEISESALGLDDDSLGLDFDYEVSGGSGSKTSGSRLIADTFSDVMKSSTMGTTTAVAKGTDMVVRSTKASTTILSSQIEKSTATLHSGLGAVYNSINQINQFLNGPMMAHLENSRTYYDNSLKLMQEQHAMTKEMLEMQRNLYSAQAKQYTNSRLDQSMNSSGMVNLRGYGKIIKGNLNDILSAYGIGGFGASGINMPMLIAAAPFKILMDAMFDNMIPKNIKKNLNSFDKITSGIFGQFIGKMNKNKNDISNGFLNMLGQIFGIDIEDKKSINTSKYNKGAVAFDGITRKTIVEVIPGYLARIEAALTGSGERHYDPHSGKWKTARQIGSDFEKERINAIESANRSITYDIAGDSRFQSKGYQKAIRRFKEQIYEDGYFDVGLEYKSGSKSDSTGRRTRSSSGDNYKKYGFRSKKDFDAFLSMLSDETIAGLATSNMRAKQARSRRMQEYEDMGSVFNILFNDSYNDGSTKSGSYSSPSKYATSNLLNISTDKYGKNVFYYLREILNGINTRWRPSTTISAPSSGKYSGSIKVRKSRSREFSTSSESEDDSGSDDDEWDSVDADLREQEEKAAEENAKKSAVKNWVDDSLNKSPIGKFFKNSINGVSKIISSPLKFINDLLEQANNNMFSLMFGDMKLEVDGEKINNVFQYIVFKIKASFDEIGHFIKTKVFNPALDLFKEKIKPWAEPIWNELKTMGGAAKARVKRGLSNTFGKAGSYIMNNLPKNIANKVSAGGVATADEVEASVYDSDGMGYGSTLYDIGANARGRVVTKRGLTMISPGEIIIPASFDKKKQDKMLALEKKDRNRIINAIGLNATGNVQTEELKKKLSQIYTENKGDNKAAKVGAGGIVGLGAGLLTGFNPFLAALAGAGLSVLDNSDTLKNIVFGEVADEETGDRKGGLISKKIQDTFKKYAPDMGDFGIAGGVLGLLTPFGPFMGAAIGAGIGFLKNSEGFKKFVFGEEGKDDDLISRKAYDAFKDKIKKAAPKMLLGAGAGILAGPFGLLGNAAIGAGVGLISTTETFQNFLYGEADENGERHGGVVDAFRTGFLEPAKEKFLEFTVDLREYSKKHIFDPMKNFWKSINQTLKNVITSVGDGIEDHINDMFERTVGLPLHDFLQEKIFKPVGKLVFGILKAPYKLGRAIISAPFRALGGIGNSLTASRIRRGTAYDMSASERLAWRDQHNIRFNRFNNYKDKRLEQDQMLANMELGDLEGIYQTSKVGLSSYAKLQKEAGEARKAVGDEVSKFFNTSTEESRNRFNKVGYSTVKKLAKIAQTESIADANEYIDKIRNLTDEEKEELKKKIAEKVKSAESANSNLDMAKTGNKQLDDLLTEALGYKVKGRKDRRKIMRSAEAELKARRKVSEKANETPEVNATNNLTEIYVKKTDSILDQLIAANKYLEVLVNPNKKDTAPPSDENKKAKDQLTKSIFEDSPSTTATDAAIEVAKEQEKNKSKGGFISKVLRFFGIGNANVDEDSKEAKEIENKAEEQAKNDKDNTAANKEQVSVLTKIKEALVGKKDTDNAGILGKLWKGIGTVGKYLGIGGLVLGGTSLFGHASQWFKTDIWPTMKTYLFGTKDEDGNSLEVGLIGRITNSMGKILLGEDGYSGLLGGMRKLIFGDKSENDGILGRIKKWFDGKLKDAKNWLSSNGGLEGLFLNKIIPNFILGIKLAIDNVGGPLVSMLIKSAGPILGSLGRAILQGIKIAVFDRKLDSASSVSIEDGGIADSLESARSNSESTIAGSMDSRTYNKIKSGLSGFNPKSTRYDSIDLSSIFKKNNSETSNGIPGILGQTTRSNVIEYDENGNRITDYTAMNTSDSLLSRTATAARRGFFKGLRGNAGKIAKVSGEKIAKSAGNMVLNVSTPGLLNKVKAVGDGISTVAKAAVNTTGAAQSVGSWINSKLTKGAVSTVADNATDNAVLNIVSKGANEAVEAVAEGAIKEASEEVLKKGIKSTAKGIFKEIANSGIAKTICKAANTFTNKAVTEKAIKELIEKIGEKITNKILQKATKSILKGFGAILSKFSVAQLAMFVIDFVWGYNNAYTILGITNDSDYIVTFGHKCVCGLVNMLTNFLTLGFITANEIIDICVEYIFPVFNLDTSKLTKARKESEAFLDKNNLDNINDPSKQYDNIQDYNNRNSWWTKTKNLFSNVFVNGSNKSTNAVSNNTRATTYNGITINPSGNGRYVGYARATNNITKIKDSYKSKEDNAKNSVYNVLNTLTSPTYAMETAMEDLSNEYKYINSKNKSALNSLTKDISRNISLASTGNINSVDTNLQSTVSNDDITGSGANAVYSLVKLFTNPISALVYSLKNIGSNIKNIVSYNIAAKNTKRNDDTKITNAMNGKINVLTNSSYWYNTSQTKNGLMGYIANIQTYLEKIVTAPISVIKTITDRVSTSFNNIKKLFSEDYGDIWDWVKSFFKTTGSGKEKTNSGRGRYGLGHIYQSGAISNMPYGDSTIGDSGCAPVAAANILNGSVRDAAQYAERNNMTVPGGGTDIKFFNSYLGSKGIPTRNTNSKSSVMNAIANGNQVVMLGQDNYNDGAPFGTNPHFITAKGISANGNIIVEDPDLPYSSIEYNPNDVMNSMISSVITGRGRRRFFGKGQAEHDLLANGGYTVSSPYGERWGKMHKGVDLCKANNAPIYAFTNGTVKYLSSGYKPDSGYYGSPDGGGFGNYVTLVDDKGYYHVYAHLNGTNVSVGQNVSRGQQIGIQGHTGSSTGSHLHYQITNGSVSGASTDPYQYLLNYNSSSSSSSSSSNTSSSSSSSSSSNTNSTTGNLLTAIGNLGRNMVKKIYGADIFNALFGDSGNIDISGNDVTDNTNINSADYVDNGNPGTKMAESYITRDIWNALRAKGFTKAGTAGIMGNMNAESAYRSNNLQDSYSRAWGLSDEEYTRLVNNGSYSKEKFAKDAGGYGLVQFTYHTLKRDLYEHTVEQGKSIASMQGQIDTIADQLATSYKSLNTYLKSTTDVQGASDKFLEQYERPADIPGTRPKRRDYSWQAYNTYKDSTTTPTANKTNTSNSSNGKITAVYYGQGRNNAGMATNALNNIRSGRGSTVISTQNSGIDYTTFLKTIIEILVSISNNTVLLNKILEILSSKFGINIDANQVANVTNGNNTVQAQNALNRLINSNSDSANMSKLINNKDTQYLLNAMAAIASE